MDRRSPHGNHLIPPPRRQQSLHLPNRSRRTKHHQTPPRLRSLCPSLRKPLQNRMALVPRPQQVFLATTRLPPRQHQHQNRPQTSTHEPPISNQFLHLRLGQDAHHNHSTNLRPFYPRVLDVVLYTDCWIELQKHDLPYLLPRTNRPSSSLGLGPLHQHHLPRRNLTLSRPPHRNRTPQPDILHHILDPRHPLHWNQHLRRYRRNDNAVARRV